MPMPLSAARQQVRERALRRIRRARQGHIRLPVWIRSDPGNAFEQEPSVLPSASRSPLPEASVAPGDRQRGRQNRRTPAASRAQRHRSRGEGRATKRREILLSHCPAQAARWRCCARRRARAARRCRDKARSDGWMRRTGRNRPRTPPACRCRDERRNPQPRSARDPNGHGHGGRRPRHC